MKRLTGTIGVLFAVLGSLSWNARAAATPPGPNGRILYTVDSRDCDDCHLTTIDPDGTDAVRIGGFVSSWSPDGTKIASSANAPDGRLATAIMDPDGSNRVVFDLVDPTLDYGCLVWFPDASRLLCEGFDEQRPHRADGIFSIDASDGSDLTRITSNPYGGGDLPGDVSPDGTRVVFQRGDPSRRHRQAALWIADIDGGNEHRISHWLGGFMCCAPSWSPDGSRILFANKGVLRTVAPDGTDEQVIPIDPGAGFSFLWQPTWSPDGARVLFVMYRTTSDQVDLYTAAADGSDLVQLTDTPRIEGFADWGSAPVME